MATYLSPPPHEKLNVFFGEFFRELRKAPPQAYGTFLARAEEEFKRTGYRDETSCVWRVKNILIFRFDSIGDMILTSGFIREVRKNFPTARITLLVYSDVRAVVELCPYVNEVLSLDRKFFVGNFVDVLEKIAVFCHDNLWQKKFSIAFSPRWHNDTFPHLVLGWLSGARERIGYGSYPFDSWQGAPPPQVAAQDNFFLTKKIVTPKSIVHDADKNFYLLKTAGFKVKKTHMELWYGAEDFQHAHELIEVLPPNCKKVMLGIGSRLMNKKYPVEMYLVALRELAKRDLVFVIVGGQSELDDANFIERNLPPGKVLNLVGKTTLRESEAVAAQVDFYLGNDTGNLHMAAAAKVPVLGLYRESVDKDDILTGVFNCVRRFAPWQTKNVILRPEYSLGDCATSPPCYGFCRHKEPHCITQITPKDIIDSFEELLTL